MEPQLYWLSVAAILIVIYGVRRLLYPPQSTAQKLSDLLRNAEYVNSQIKKHDIKLVLAECAVVEILWDTASQSTGIHDICPKKFSSLTEAYEYVEPNKHDEYMFYVVDAALEIRAIKAGGPIMYVEK